MTLRERLRQWRAVLFMLGVTAIIVMVASSAWSQPLLNENGEYLGTVTISGDPNVAYITGRIGELTANYFESLDLEQVRILVLRSDGGSLGYGMTIARLVREHEITTQVPAGARCSSACTVIFQGGITRQAYESSQFLYHLVRKLNSTTELIQYSEEGSSWMFSSLISHGLNREFVYFTIQMAPRDMILNGRQAVEFNIVTELLE